MIEPAPLRLGVVGLGLAGSLLVRAARHEADVELAGAADPSERARTAFARDLGVEVHAEVESLCRRPDIDAIAVCTPHHLHAEHAVLASRHGKHVLVEKPMALSLAECDMMIDAARANGTALIVGPTHAYDPPIRSARQVLISGEIGRAALIATWNYKAFIFLPRRPDELDTGRGGGVVFNQVPHQLDQIRMLGGGLLRSVRGSALIADPARGTEGAATAFLDFEDGTAASLVFSGYGYFDSDEWHGGVGEGGEMKAALHHGQSAKQFRERGRPDGDETALRASMFGYGDIVLPATRPPLLPHFGLTVITAEYGEVRTAPDGVIVYTAEGESFRPSAGGSGWPTYQQVFDELRCAIAQEPVVHDGPWGKATLEAALALLTSSRERREVRLHHQVPVPAGR